MTNEDLCILAQSGNADAESELIDHLLPSLKALAAKFEAQYSGLQIEADDLLQEGSIGLLRAVYSFRPEKGYLFHTFASRVSENAMMDYVRKCVSAIPTTGQMLSLDIEPYNDPERPIRIYRDTPTAGNTIIRMIHGILIEAVLFWL